MSVPRALERSCHVCISRQRQRFCRQWLGTQQVTDCRKTSAQSTAKKIFDCFIRARCFFLGCPRGEHLHTSRILTLNQCPSGLFASHSNVASSFVSVCSVLLVGYAKLYLPLDFLQQLAEFTSLSLLGGTFKYFVLKFLVNCKFLCSIFS